MTTDVTMSVPDISCNHCKTSIEGALTPLDGVDSAVVSIDDRAVSVAYDPDTMTLDQIKDAIEGQGYEVESSA